MNLWRMMLWRRMLVVQGYPQSKLRKGDGDWGGGVVVDEVVVDGGDDDDGVVGANPHVPSSLPSHPHPQSD